jgi:hypothetical protein
MPGVRVFGTLHTSGKDSFPGRVLGLQSTFRLRIAQAVKPARLGFPFFQGHTRPLAVRRQEPTAPYRHLQLRSL